MAKNYDETKDEMDMMTLTLDDGSEIECEIISIFPAGNQTYIALLPVKTPDGYEENDVLLYRYAEAKNGTFELITIDTDDEFEIAADAFDEILDEMEFNAMPEND